MQPPFHITTEMMNRVVEISQRLGQLEFQLERQLTLRKENRIRSIHSSLAIEQNSLSVEQITAIIDGKRVAGAPKEIKEVQNAYRAYEEILRLNPYKEKDFLKAHGFLTEGIVKESGRYRSTDVGIYNQDGTVIHMGARPQFIHNLMSDLFAWGAEDQTPALIKSCIFHYEIETIHPFEDGNGRMGRLWQTVILAHWSPAFAWIPIETIIHAQQEEYYAALRRADEESESTLFIEFMLDMILQALNTYSIHTEETVPSPVLEGMTDAENNAWRIIAKYLADYPYITVSIAAQLTGKSASTIRKYLAKYAAAHLLQAHGGNKNRSYSLGAETR